jgi:hypothetical protein
MPEDPGPLPAIGKNHTDFPVQGSVHSKGPRKGLPRKGLSLCPCREKVCLFVRVGFCQAAMKVVGQHESRGRPARMTVYS